MVCQGLPSSALYGFLRKPRTSSHWWKRSGQFATGRKAHHADAIGIHAPFGSAAAHQPDGPLGIGKRGSLDGVGRASLACQPVLQDEARHATLTQPTGDVVALMVHPKGTVP